MLTVYNPYSIQDPLFYAAFEQILAPINAMIKGGQMIADQKIYNVIDIHDIFASSVGTTLVNFKPALGALDPHPTALGHQLIFNSHITHVASVTLDKTTASLKPGDILKLVSTLAPQNALNQDLSWTSDNSAVATVAQDGTVTALANGTAKITAATEDGNLKADCTITITTAVEGISLNKTSEKLNVGDELQLMSVFTPDTASNKNVTWQSSDSNIATVDNTGKVKAIKTGTATVTVVSADGNKRAQCSITVNLVQTGYPVDMNVLFGIGIILIVSGFLANLSHRKLR